MFEFIRNNTRWMMGIITALSAVAFIAPQGYAGFMEATSTGVATVDGHKITQAEWDAAHRLASERLRQENPQIDAKALDSEAARYGSLDNLVQQRLLQAAAQHQHLEVADARLEGRFANDPSLAPFRDPSGGVNKALLAAQGLSKDGFILRLRQDLQQRQVLAPLAPPADAANAAPGASARLATDTYLQRREVQWQRIDPSAFVAQVSVTDTDLEAYYKEPATQKRWTRPESAQIEYLVLDLAALRDKVQVNEADLRTYYAQNAARYNTAEERRVSHILLKLDPKADAGQEKAQRDKAEKLLAELRKAPQRFAELARQHSEDVGSAGNGGDLDFIQRGAMVKPFEDASFALQVGELSPIVRSEFGLHLIRLEAVRGGNSRPFEAVRAELETEQRNQLARQRYSELAEQFSTLVYEQSDSLEPAAQKLGLTTQKAQVTRSVAPGATGPLGSAKLMDAVFSADSVRSKRNTDAVETAPNQMVAARVLEHRPAAPPALAEVRDAVKQQLVLGRAAELARKAGEARLAQGAASSDGLQPAQWVSRIAPAGLPGPVLEAVLKADTQQLPKLLGSDQANAGYWIVKVLQVGKTDPAQAPVDLLARQIEQTWRSAEAQAYVNALKKTHKVHLEVQAPKPAAAEGASGG